MNVKNAVQRSERVLCQRADETVVLLALDSGEYFSLDEVGGRIWELCDGTRSAEEITVVLASEYDATREEIERDVIELLTELEGARLISV